MTEHKRLSHAHLVNLREINENGFGPLRCDETESLFGHIAALEAELAEVTRERDAHKRMWADTQTYREEYNKAVLDFDIGYIGADYLKSAIDVIKRAKIAESQVGELAKGKQIAEKCMVWFMCGYVPPKFKELCDCVKEAFDVNVSEDKEAVALAAYEYLAEAEYDGKGIVA